MKWVDSRSRMRMLAVLGLVCAAGCGREVLPDALTFRGTPLAPAGAWSRGGLSGVVFVAPGQAMPAAPLQVGLIHSRDHATGESLQVWALERFHESPLIGRYVSPGGDEACKTGALDLGDKGVRVFVAIHVCRTGVGESACGEVDEAIDGNEFSCVVDPSCAQRLCDARWPRVREDLEPILTSVLAAR